MHRRLSDRHSLFYYVYLQINIYICGVKLAWVALAHEHCIKFTIQKKAHGYLSPELPKLFDENGICIMADVDIVYCRAWLSVQHILPHFYAFLLIALQNSTKMDSMWME